MFTEIIHFVDENIIKNTQFDHNLNQKRQNNTILIDVLSRFEEPQKISSEFTGEKQFLTEQFDKEQPLKPKKKRIRTYLSTNPKNKKGHWTKTQTLKYHYFLEINYLHFIDKQRRKIDKVFKLMSDFIETREPHQCRSHHQKVQKKWGSFINILLNLRIQNFQSHNSNFIVKEFQKNGFNITEILDQKLLIDSQIHEILYNCTSQQNEDNQMSAKHSINQMNANDKRISCLLMSENYEDQLII